jgi:hypothetical protein
MDEWGNALDAITYKCSHSLPVLLRRSATFFSHIMHMYRRTAVLIRRQVTAIRSRIEPKFVRVLELVRHGSATT